jgi:SAM-dependent methyltransferase
MFKKLREINSRPSPYEFYTAEDLWTDDYTSKQMLNYHLNESIDVSSRNKDFIKKSEKWIAARFNVNDKTEIADFGCGPGLYTTRFAVRDAKVTGIDFSHNSISYAKKIAIDKGLDIKYFAENYLDFETTDRFDLITMIMCDFCALSPEQRKLMLSKFYSLLKPGGSVLLDVYSINSFDQKDESATYEKNQLYGFWSPDDYYGFVNTFKYEKDKVTLDKYTIIEDSRKRIVYNWLQHFSPETLIKEFEAIGFKIEDVYSDIAGKTFDSESPEIAIVAKRL